MGVFRSSRPRAQQLIQTALIIPIITILIEFLDPLLLLTTNIDRFYDSVTVRAESQVAEFDFIIVGAGSAGSILASRLSEDESISVLLLEAGGLPSPITAIPTIAFLLGNKTAHDWGRRTTSQRNAAFSLKNHVVFWPSGKGLGGSTIINGLINIRRNIQGYDLIANRTGDPIWESKNILQFYKKVENYNGWFDKENHGTNGDMSIEAPPLVPATYYFLRAGQEMGYPVRDPNSFTSNVEGFAPMEFYTKKGARSDTYHSTIKKRLHRKNLTVRKFSFVTKLLFQDEGEENVVVGVQYERHGKTYEARARKDTILSAGALSTPKILMLSGIGPKRHLEDMKIPVRLNLPVGERLQDKYGAFIGPFIVPKGYSFDQDRDMNMSSIWDWYINGKGILSSARSEATFAINSPTSIKNGDTLSPDIHGYLLSQHPRKPEKLLGEAFNFNEATLDYMRKAGPLGDSIFQLVTVNRPIGFGTVRLVDTNPRSHPEINPKYLENPYDLKILVEVAPTDPIKFAVDLVEKTKAMQEIGAKLFRVPYPGCENYEFKSDSYYACLARHPTMSAFKYCGTATIGTKDDPEAVVDSRFRVFGTKGLRIIDGSLLRINEVNTNDVTLRMIGELGSFVLREGYGLHRKR